MYYIMYICNLSLQVNFEVVVWKKISLWAFNLSLIYFNVIHGIHVNMLMMLRTLLQSVLEGTNKHIPYRATIAC